MNMCGCVWAGLHVGMRMCLQGGIVSGFESPFAGLGHGLVLSLHLNIVTVKQRSKLLSKK